MTQTVDIAVSDRPVKPEAQALSDWVNKECVPILKKLRDAINGLDDDGATPGGPAGGQLDGTYPDPTVVGLTESSGPTELTMGAVADGEFLKREGAVIVGGEADFTSEGCIFSMVGPLGADPPIVAYDFTRYDPALSVAQNLINANMSGDSNFDLVAVAGGGIIRQENGGITTVGNFDTVRAGRVDGGALFSHSGANYASVGSARAEFQLLGALTVEWLGHFAVSTTGAGDAWLWWCSGSGEAEAENMLYGLRWDGATTDFRYAHEAGAGVDSVATVSGSYDLNVQAFTRPNPMHFVLTRAASTGRVNGYVNGRRIMPDDLGALPAPSALPTGGGNAVLSIAPGSDATNRMLTLGFRIFDTVLTADQIRESWERTRFGRRA